MQRIEKDFQSVHQDLHQFISPFSRSMDSTSPTTATTTTATKNHSASQYDQCSPRNLLKTLLYISSKTLWHVFFNEYTPMSILRCTLPYLRKDTQGEQSSPFCLSTQMHKVSATRTPLLHFLQTLTWNSGCFFLSTRARKNLAQHSRRF